MIALDTNAFLRWIAVDALPAEDAPQVAAVLRLLSEVEGPIWIGNVVLAETVWTLRKEMRQTRSEVAALLTAALIEPRLRFADAEAVAAARDAYVLGGPGFADHLIGALAERAGCRTAFRFDRQAAKLSTFTLIAV